MVSEFVCVCMYVCLFAMKAVVLRSAPGEEREVSGVGHPRPGCQVK